MFFLLYIVPTHTLNPYVDLLFCTLLNLKMIEIIIILFGIRNWTHLLTH